MFHYLLPRGMTWKSPPHITLCLLTTLPPMLALLHLLSPLIIYFSVSRNYYKIRKPPTSIKSYLLMAVNDSFPSSPLHKMHASAAKFSGFQINLEHVWEDYLFLSGAKGYTRFQGQSPPGLSTFEMINILRLIVKFFLRLKLTQEKTGQNDFLKIFLKRSAFILSRLKISWKNIQILSVYSFGIFGLIFRQNIGPMGIFIKISRKLGWIQIIGKLNKCEDCIYKDGAEHADNSKFPPLCTARSTLCSSIQSCMHAFLFVPFFGLCSSFIVSWFCFYALEACCFLRFENFGSAFRVITDSVI